MHSHQDRSAKTISKLGSINVRLEHAIANTISGHIQFQIAHNSHRDRDDWISFQLKVDSGENCETQMHFFGQINYRFC